MHNMNRVLIKRGTRLAFLALTVTSLTGCNSAFGPDNTTTSSVFKSSQSAAFEHSIAERKPIEAALVRLPRDSGQLLHLSESRYGNGLEQTIFYKGDINTFGENKVVVRLLQNKVWPRPKKSDLSLRPVTQRALAAEMGKALSGVRMQVSNVLHTNAYGPFGYALGRTAGNIHCIYGWQNLKGHGHEPWGLFTKASNRPELSLRMRICRTGVTNKQLVNLMKRVRIEADPTRALNATSVSWSSGPKSNTSALLPSYQSGGYVSQGDVANEAAAYRAQPIVRRKTRNVRKSRVVKQTKRQQRVVETTRHAGTHRVKNPTKIRVPLPPAEQPLQDFPDQRQAGVFAPVATSFPTPNASFPTRISSASRSGAALTTIVPLP